MTIYLPMYVYSLIYIIYVLHEVYYIPAAGTRLAHAAHKYVIFSPSTNSYTISIIIIIDWGYNFKAGNKHHIAEHNTI